MGAADEAIRPWSRDKLELLGKYLRAYSVIMGRQKETWLKCFSYIDAFASVGTYLDRESGEYIDGSPLVALRCEPPFDEYWFIEQSESRLDALKYRVRTEFEGRIMHFRPGDANIVLQRDVIPIITRASGQRAIVFLDPYGLEVDYETVRSLSEASTFDVFMNLSTMGITRLCRRHELPDSQVRGNLLRVMGDITWLDRVYEVQTDMFGDDVASRDPFDPQSIAQNYLANLRKLFPYVSEPVMMRNSRNAPLCVLFLASHNRTAVKITNDTFRTFERLRYIP